MSTNFYRAPEFNDPLPKPLKPAPSLGYRLVRVFVVFGSILLLIALLLPLIRNGSGSAARRAQCVNNLKQIALALHSYEEANGALPPAWTVDRRGQQLHSWRTLILPYLEQKDLYQTIDLSKPWNDPANAKALESSVSVFHCPSAKGPTNTTTYLAVIAPNGCFIPTKPRRLAEITDGVTSTLMLIEAGEENAVPWMAPADADESVVLNFGKSARLPHEYGTNTCFVDGSVRFVTGRISTKLLRSLITISGNDAASDERY